MVANEGVEQVELTRPWDAVVDAGGRPLLVAPNGSIVQAMHHLDKADRFEVDQRTDELSVSDVDAVVLPGGVANADQLRLDVPAVNFLASFVAAGKPVAVICHGPWSLVEADAVRDRRITSWPSLRTDIANAGGHWVDEEVVVCTSGPNTLVSSRKPDDLDAFCATATEVFATFRAQASARG